MPRETYGIARARTRDLARVASIEIAAARLLVDHAPASQLASTTALAELRHASRRGHLWIARAQDEPVGFAMARCIEAGALHLLELHVDPAHGRRGLGTRLVNAVCARAKREKLQWVTLTTFRDLAWNMPFYARLGFELSTQGVLDEILEDDRRNGLYGRVGMRRACVPP